MEVHDQVIMELVLRYWPPLAVGEFDGQRSIKIQIPLDEFQSHPYLLVLVHF